MTADRRVLKVHDSGDYYRKEVKPQVRLEDRWLLNDFKKLAAAAGLPPIRFHEIRHTAATLMLQQEVNPKIVQEILGHSDVNLTLDTYSHVIPTLQKEAAVKLEGVLTLTEVTDKREQQMISK